MNDNQLINPWVANTSNSKGFDYNKLLNDFGTKPITPELIERIEKITKMQAHRFLRRGLFFSQQYLEQFLNHYEAGLPCYMYTGRGPSSESMHLGHMIPFEFTKYLQDAFGLILIIQMSDDEKYYFKGENDLKYYNNLVRENVKDIIACGFNPTKTYIYSNFNEIANGNPGMWKNIVEMNSYTKVNQIRSMFGLNQLDTDKLGKSTAAPCSIGMMSWPVFQSVPCFASSFKFIFGDDINILNNTMCLVPMAVDQAVYFRLVDDYAAHAKLPKPAQIHSEFLSGLCGPQSKMSSTNLTGSNTSTIFLTDDEKTIRKKIKSCGSGGKPIELQMDIGADLTIDVSYQWLITFMESDEELEQIAKRYAQSKDEGFNGNRMMTSEIKTIIADIIVEYLGQHQSRRNLIDDNIINEYFSKTKVFDKSIPHRQGYISTLDYQNYGVNFDRYFGLDITKLL
jgi:tryptophanyl-tRNA synthetase